MYPSTFGQADHPDCCPVCGTALAVEAANGSGRTCPKCKRPLWFVRKAVEDAVVITFLTGLVSAHATPQQVDELLAAIGPCARVVLDLSRLRFMPASFLKLLVLLNHRLDPRICTRMCGLDAMNSTALRRTRIDRLFDICENQEEALEHDLDAPRVVKHD